MGYQSGYADGLAKVSNGSVQYTYHYHSNSCYKTYYIQGCTKCGNGYNWLDYTFTECGSCGRNAVEVKQTENRVICGYNQGQIVSAKITF